MAKEKITFQSAYTLWLGLLKRSKSPLTVKKYSLYLKPLVERLKDFELTELTDKQGYLLGFATSFYDTEASRRNFLFSYNSFRRFVEEYFNLKLPVFPKDFASKQPVKEPKPLKEEHFKVLLRAVKELPDVETDRVRNVSFKLTFLLQSFAGLRIREALTLTPDRVHFKERDDKEYAEILVKGKGNKERRIPIFEPFTVSYLKEYLDYLPPNLTDRGYNKRLQQIYRKAVVSELGEQPERIHAHRLRDTYLTKLADSGVDIRVLQEIAGHSSIEMTRKYVGLKDERILGDIEKAFNR